MIKLFSNASGISADITNFVKSITWSGDKSQAARKIDVTMAYSIFDKNQPRVGVSSGTMVWLVDDVEGEIFRGIVFNRSITSNEELKFTAYDYLIYFLKSKASFNFTNTTAEAIATKVCGEVAVTAGSMASTGVKFSLLVQAKTLYEIIMEGYATASKTTGKQYIPTMMGTKLNVIERGKNVIDYTLNPDTNMISSEYGDDIDSMVNKVKVYGGNGQATGQVVQNTAWQKSFGILQDTYDVQADKNSTVEANLMLKGQGQRVTVDALGNVKVVTGNSVKTKIYYINVLANATWFVDADTHTWEVATGKYTMQLSLSSSNIM